MTRTSALLLATLAVAACSSTSSNSGSSGTSSSTGGSSGSSGSSGSTGSAGAGCTTGTHAVEDGGCGATLGAWTTQPTLEKARDHHVTFIAEVDGGAFLFAGGGTNYVFDWATLERAPILDDGGLGAFAYADALPAELVGAGVVNLDARTVLIAGGLGSDGATVATTHVATVADDGSVTYADGPTMNADRYHLTLTRHGGYVYAIGGLQQAGTSQSFSSAIERAPVTGATVGAFESLTAYPSGLTHQAAVVHGESLYLVGGVQDVAPQLRTTVQRADLHADGTLGAFTDVGTLPEPRVTSSALVLGDELFVLAGGTDVTGGAVDTVLHAHFLADGSVTAFDALTALPVAREHAHQSPWRNGVVYSVGGSDSSQHVQGGVFAAPLR